MAYELDFNILLGAHLFTLLPSEESEIFRMLYAGANKVDTSKHFHRSITTINKLYDSAVEKMRDHLEMHHPEGQFICGEYIQ